MKLKKEKFIEINKAYKILSNPEKKKIYDETGAYDEAIEQDRTLSLVLEAFQRVILNFTINLDNKDIIKMIIDTFEKNLKGADETIKFFIEGGIIDINRQIKKVEQEKEKWEKAIKFIKKYNWECSEESSPFGFIHFTNHIGGTTTI